MARGAACPAGYGAVGGLGQQRSRRRRCWGEAMTVGAAVFRASVRADTAYRGAFLARAGEGVASLALSIGFYGLIYTRTDGIEGWTYAQMLTLAGTFEIVRAIVQALFIRNLPALQDRIRKGDLDYDLIVPVSTRFLVSCRRLSVMSVLPPRSASSWWPPEPPPARGGLRRRGWPATWPYCSWPWPATTASGSW